MRFGLTFDVDAVFADLDEMDRQVPRQVQGYLQVTANRYQSQARAITPVGKPKPKRRPMISGWSVRQRGPFRFHVVNTRPHAHLVERGFTHVSGRQVQGIQRLIPLAQSMRNEMVRDMTRIIGPNFGGRLRALEMTT